MRQSVGGVRGQARRRWAAGVVTLLRGACILCGGGGGGGCGAARRQGGWTPLILASINGHQSVVEALIGSKANIEAKDKVSLSRDAGGAAQQSTPPGSECRLGQVCRGMEGRWGGGGGLLTHGGGMYSKTYI